MEGYLLDFETPDGQQRPHWDYSSNILYKVEEKDGVSVDVTVKLALDRIASSLSDYNRRINTTNALIIDCQSDILALQSDIRNINNILSNLNVTVAFDVDPETGNWIINGEPTEYPSRGENGSSFTYEDLTAEQIAELAQNIASSLGGVTGGGGGVAGKGSFSMAWHYACDDIAVIDPETGTQQVDENDQPVYTDRKTELFSWVLDDYDANNNHIVKIIYHMGDGNFIDALGATIIGSGTGLTIS